MEMELRFRMCGSGIENRRLTEVELESLRYLFGEVSLHLQ